MVSESWITWGKTMDKEQAKKIIRQGFLEHKKQTATEKELQTRENRCCGLDSAWAVDTAKGLSQKEYNEFISKLESFKKSGLPFSAWKDYRG